MERELLLQELGKVPPIDEFHGDVVSTVFGGAEIDDVDGVGMLEAAGRPRLTVKPLRKGHIAGKMRMEHLDADDLTQGYLLRPVDAAHGALAHQLLDQELLRDGTTYQTLFLSVLCGDSFATVRAKPGGVGDVGKTFGTTLHEVAIRQLTRTSYKPI